MTKTKFCQWSLEIRYKRGLLYTQQQFKKKKLKAKKFFIVHILSHSIHKIELLIIKLILSFKLYYMYQVFCLFLILAFVADYSNKIAQYSLFCVDLESRVLKGHGHEFSLKFIFSFLMFKMLQ